MFDHDSKGSTGAEASTAESAAPGRDVPDAGPVDRALATAGQGERVEGAVLHTDGVAAEAAASINAHAFTAGQDVYFGAGQYSPGSTGGDQLIAHEMAHVEQAQGVAAPSPGNYEVAPSTAPQETEARQWAGGGLGGTSMMADPGTIYRAEIGTGVAANVVAHGGTAEAGATAGGHDGAQFNMLAARGAGEDDKDPLQAFRLAVVAGSKSQALSKWAKVPVADKAKLATEKDTLLRAMQIIGAKSLNILDDVGVDPTTDIRFAQEILWHGDGAGWHTELKAKGWVTKFLQANPKKAQLDKKSIQHLEFYTRDNDTDATDAFEKAYAKLGTTDLTVGTDWKFYAIAWDQSHINRAYKALMKNRVPPAHLASANSLVLSDSYENPVGTFKGTLDFGYYDGASNIVIPEEDAGTPNHDMAGGKGQKGPKMKHFESTMLHEVGHLVADQLSEYGWGATSGSPLEMENTTAADVQTELWNSAKNHNLGGAHPDPVSEADAKLVLEAEAVGTTGAFTSTTWSAAGKDQATFDKNVKTQYSGQALYKMAKKMAGDTDNAYPHAMQGETTKTKMYSFLSRFNGSWSKFNKTAWDARVSFYSMSSPGEWFAEQYSYYMSTNGKATLADVKTKMVDVMKRLDAAAGTPAMTSPGAGAAPAGPGAPGATGTAPAAPGADPTAGPHVAGGGAAPAGGPGAAGAPSTLSPVPRGHRFAWTWG